MERITALGFVLLIGIFSFSSAENFSDFLENQHTEFSGSQGDFDTYSKSVNQEYDAYKKVVREEYDKFRKQLSAFWEDPEIGDRKKWVEYSKDMQTRKSVDFENNTIEVDIIVPRKDEKPRKNKEFDKEINKILTDLLLEDKQTAVNRDPLTDNIQKKINEKNINTKTDNVENTPILTTALTGTPTPTQKQIEETIEDLRSKETTVTKPSKVKNKDVVKVTIPLPSDFPVKKAMEYKTDVSHYADKRNIDDAVVFAVIHTESAFNPLARSPVPAYGLMQIVPQSAGLDATKLVYGKQVLLSPEYLYNSKNNIHMGTTYIYILYYRYLKDIENPESRLYCTIAAYNTGAGNVARAFTGSTSISKAVRVINGMSPKKVYNRLLKRLPYSESRTYLVTVSERMDIYKGMGN